MMYFLQAMLVWLYSTTIRRILVYSQPHSNATLFLPRRVTCLVIAMHRSILRWNPHVPLMLRSWRHLLLMFYSTTLQDTLKFNQICTLFSRRTLIFENKVKLTRAQTDSNLAYVAQSGKKLKYAEVFPLLQLRKSKGFGSVSKCIGFYWGFWSVMQIDPEAAWFGANSNISSWDFTMYQDLHECQTCGRYTKSRNRSFGIREHLIRTNDETTR